MAHFDQYILLLFGLVLLVEGADYFVEGSSGIALMFGVSPLFIGLTLVAFGTSAPEAAVSIQASLKQANSIALGNVIGSNIANIGLVLGLTAIFNPVLVPKSTLNKEIPFVIISTMILGLMMFYPFDASAGNYLLDQKEGTILLLIFMLFLGYTLNMARKDRLDLDVNNGFKDADRKDSVKFVIMSIGGIITIGFAGNMVVDASVVLAKYHGVSEKFIGATIIAIGTSLPELVTSVVAAIKKEADIAIGNIIGSCIFNILFVLGISSAVHTMAVENSFFVDVLVATLLAFLTLIFSIKFFDKDKTSENSINRIEGYLLLLVYIAYIVYLLIRL